MKELISIYNAAAVVFDTPGVGNPTINAKNLHGAFTYARGI